MNKEITLQGVKISYKMRRSGRAQRMRISVYPDASVTVTAPEEAREDAIDYFLKENREWLISNFTKIKKRALFTNKDYREYKDKAYKLISERVYSLNKLYGYKINNIRVKNQKTIWGSCSRRKNLNFNYKIIFLPQRVRDYIIVHEICHLKELNHSERFWGLVSSLFPDYKEIKKELYNYSRGL